MGGRNLPSPASGVIEPALAEKTAALDGLEMGHVVKIVMAFRERFWEGAFADEAAFLMTEGAPFHVNAFMVPKTGLF